jgi:hypothetical protein
VCGNGADLYRVHRPAYPAAVKFQVRKSQVEKWSRLEMVGPPQRGKRENAPSFSSFQKLRMGDGNSRSVLGSELISKVRKNSKWARAVESHPSKDEGWGTRPSVPGKQPGVICGDHHRNVGAIWQRQRLENRTRMVHVVVIGHRQDTVRDFTTFSAVLDSLRISRSVYPPCTSVSRFRPF